MLDDNMHVILTRSQLEAFATVCAEKAVNQYVKTWSTYNKQEAAERLGVSTRTINNWIAKGELECKNGLIAGLEISRRLSLK